MIRALLVLVGLIMLAVPDGARAQIDVLEPDADSYVRTDVNSRRNDNYGCDPNIIVGTGRGGGGMPFGAPDAIRLLLQFDLSGFTQPTSLAVLELTISNFHSDDGPQTFVLQAHRLLSPWNEGNGNEQTNDTPAGCVPVDPAFGMAWVGAGDGGDDNNQTQPDFDPTITATEIVDMVESGGTGEIRHWDVTTLVNGWITGVWPNHGIVIRDPTSDGPTFRQIGFGSSETESVVSNDPNWPSVTPGPRLKLYQTIAVESQSWGQTKAMYQD